MKKVVRWVWICALSGLAFLGACCTQNGLTRKERKQLLMEREQVEMQLSNYKNDEIDTPFVDEYMARRSEKYALENKLDSINFCLGASIDLDRNMRRRQILQRIDSLTFLIENYTPACIYGSPEMMEGRVGRVKVDNDFERLERQLEEANRELVEFEISGLPNKRTEGRAADVLYGSPDVIRQIKK